MTEESPKRWPGMKFKDYYQSDPEFRAKHRAYMSVKVPCANCGELVARSNMSKHKVTRRCQEGRQTCGRDGVKAKTEPIVEVDAHSLLQDRAKLVEALERIDKFLAENQ